MEPSLSHRFPQRAALINLLLIGALVLLLLGVFAPLLTLEKFYFFNNRISLFSGLMELLLQGELLLFIVIGVFSVIFPISKLFLLGSAVNLPGDRHHGPLRWLEATGKWSMLDVFVVALLLVSIKLEGMASVEVHFGAYAFGASVLLTMVLVEWVYRLIDQTAVNPTT